MDPETTETATTVEAQLKSPGLWGKISGLVMALVVVVPILVPLYYVLKTDLTSTQVTAQDAQADAAEVVRLMAPEIMPCGLGVCGGCAVESKRGVHYPCTDGPVFDLTQI